MSDEAPHILVVDDDRRLRDLLQRYLSDQGFRVTVAAGAEEARAKLTSLTFDLLVLDIMMPGESGLELTRSLRAKSRVPVLLLTAMGETEDRIAGLECGADDYLSKPFEPRELVLRINAILRRATVPEATSDGKIYFGGFCFDLAREVSAESPTIGTARAIDVQVARLRRKIESDAKYPRHLQAARGIGYVLVPD
jgi:two-component system phosphate regulon response regulator OmpR